MNITQITNLIVDVWFSWSQWISRDETGLCFASGALPGLRRLEMATPLCCGACGAWSVEDVYCLSWPLGWIWLTSGRDLSLFVYQDVVRLAVRKCYLDQFAFKICLCCVCLSKCVLQLHNRMRGLLCCFLSMNCRRPSKYVKMLIYKMLKYVKMMIFYDLLGSSLILFDPLYLGLCWCAARMGSKIGWIAWQWGLLCRCNLSFDDQMKFWRRINSETNWDMI